MSRGGTDAGAGASQGGVGLFEERYGRLPRGGLAALGDLVARFEPLPYENLTKILALETAGPGAPPLRMPARVMADHLALGTGGTCFSLTELLRELVLEAGFDAHPVMAHMRHGANIHCALRVEAQGRAYLVDPGYLVRRPLALTAAPGRAEVGEPLLLRVGALAELVPPGVPPGDFDLFTREPSGPRWRYRFSDHPAPREVFLAHWQQSFRLPGLRSLIVTRRDAVGRRLYLHDHKLRRSGGGEASTTRNVRQELAQAVAQSFGIDPEVTSRASAAVEAARQGRGRGDRRGAQD